MTRLGLVGYGRIAPKHLEVFRALGCEWAACCDHTEANRRRAVESGDFRTTYASVGEMLKADKIDGIIVCPSFDQVYDVAAEAMPFGVPMLLEKPPGTRHEQCRRLQDLAEKHRTPIMVGLNRRRYSVVERAIADAGGRDNITAVFIEWSEDPWYLRDKRKFRPEQVAGWIYGNSLHGLDLLTFLAGDIAQPTVHARNFGEPCRWMMALQGVSDRGVLASFHSTWDSPSRWRVVFCTPHRRYTFAPLESCSVMERDAKEPRTIEPDEIDRQFKPGFHPQAVSFLQMIADRKPPALQSLAASAPAMRLADLLTDACRQA